MNACNSPFLKEMDDKNGRQRCDFSSEQFKDIYNICTISFVHTAV